MRRAFLALALLLTLAPAAAGTAQALADYDYENLQFRGVGLDYGYLWTERIRDTEMFGLRIDLGYLGPGVRIIPSITYWSSRFTLDELNRLAARIRQVSGSPVTPTGNDLDPIRWSDLSLSVDAHFVWNTPVRVLTFVGAGAGLHALNGQGAAIEDTFVEDLLDSITAALSVMTGFEFEPVRRFRLYVEGRYTAMPSLQYLSARGGLQFMFTRGRGVEVGAIVPPPPLSPDEP